MSFIDSTNEELVKKYQETKDNRILESLIEKNIGFIYKVYRCYGVDQLKLVEEEDMIQEGQIGLMEAAQKYDFNNEKRAGFTTYAFFHIKKRMSRYIKKRKIYESSLNDLVPGTDKEVEVVAIIKDNKDYFEEADTRVFNDWLRINEEKLMLELLTLKQREITKMRFGFSSREMTINEISELFDCSLANITNTLDISIKKLRKTEFMKELFLEFRVNRDAEERMYKPDRYAEMVDNELHKYMTMFN